MKRIQFIISMLILSSLLYAAPEDTHRFQDRFLICLQQDIKLGKSLNKYAQPVTGISSLDQLMVLRGVVKMEKYLPAATADDVIDGIDLSNVYRLRIEPGHSSVDQLLKEFDADINVLYTEHEAMERLSYIPNDPSFGAQWAPQKIMAPEAWDLWDIAGGDTPGNVNIVLASVDTGVEYTHPDLWQRAWVNQAEIPAAIFSAVDTDNNGVVTPVEVVAHISDFNADGVVNLQDALHSSSPFMNGLDDDDWDESPSTYIDDLFGWDPAGTTSGIDEDNDPMGAFVGTPDFGTRVHGTHVAGLLAATTDNGSGMASTVYNGSLMSVKCLYDEAGTGGYLQNLYSGLLYAAKAGADIINASWGSSFYSPTNQAVINVIYKNYGVLIVAAAGNGDDAGNPIDTPHYPSGYDNVVSVTAVSASDIFRWANYGNGEGNPDFYGIDISAPGESLLSTIFTTSSTYGGMTGTSMASPLTASAFGLLKSVYPDSSNDWLIENMLSSADPIDHLNPDFATHLGAGRLNIYNALGHLLIPSISYDSYSLQLVNDDGNGQLSPGEEAFMRVNLQNKGGWVDAADVNATLRSDSPYITINDSTGHYTGINSGSIGINILDRYNFTISNNAPSGEISLSLEITANQSSDNPYSVILDFTIDVSMWQTNFPVAITGFMKSGNAVVDLDGDGSQEIIFGAYDSLLHAFNEDGTELPGFPVFLNYVIDASPAVGDIDNDGDLEVVVGGRDYSIHVVQHDGQHESIYTAASYIWAPSALYDLDNDGDLEIITITYYGKVILLHHDGTLFNSSFDVSLGTNTTNGLAIGDIDSDGEANIVVTSTDKKLHAFNLDGTEISGFPVDLADRVKSSAILTNLDGSADGSLEILLGTNDNRMHAFDGSGLELWQFNAGQDIQSDPAVSDMDGDGDLEIVFMGVARNIYVLDHTGVILPGWPAITGGSIYSSPALADIDGDGMAEVFSGSMDKNIYGFHLDGSTINGFPAKMPAFINGSITISDLDGDNDAEIIVGVDQELVVLDIPVQSDGIMDFWPTHRGNLHRTGFYLNTTVSLASENELPGEFKLHKNYPNPFNPSTSIGFDVPISGAVDLEIIDIRGRVVETLVSEHMEPGVYSVVWDGSFRGKPASAGVYLYRLSTPSGVLIQKMTLLK